MNVVYTGVSLSDHLSAHFSALSLKVRGHLALTKTSKSLRGIELDRERGRLTEQTWKRLQSEREKQGLTAVSS